VKFRFLAVIVGVVLLVLAAHDVPLAMHISRIERDRLITTLERDAYVLSGRVNAIMATDADALRVQTIALLDQFSTTNDATAVITDKYGYLLASTSGDDLAGEDYATRPEINSALFGRFTSGVRSSSTIGEDLIYVAVPIASGNSVLGVVRLTYPKSIIDARVADRVRSIVMAAGVSVAMAVLAAFLLASVISRPLTNLRNATDRFALGDVSTTVDEQGPIETRQLAKSFNSMAIRVNNMLDRQRSFSGDASHQMRTPLTALRLRLEQAGDSIETVPAVAREHIEAALNETDRLTNLTEQLLRLARTEGAVLKPAIVDVNNVLNELCDEWSFLAAENEIELILEDTDQLECLTNELALREIIGNYIDNAIEHSPPKAKINVIAQRISNQVVIIIRDQGPGLTADQRARAFDRFWRGARTRDSASGAQGSGLGLAIAAQLALSSNMNLELAQPPSGIGIDAIVKIKTN
jgi:signal transduction histidine kinase